MKLVGNATLLANGLLLAAMLGACQNENAPIPQATSTVSDRNAKTQSVGQLIKDGSVSLAYNNQDPSALWKEIFDNGARHEFTYGKQSITGKRFINGFPNPTMVFTYTLDSDGRCTETTTNNKTHVYDYDANGQLKKYYNKSQPNERTEFTYKADADGITNSLFAVTFYNASGTKTRVLEFNYNLNQPIPDKSPLNPDVFPTGISKYIPVFGKFSSNLVQCSADKKFTNGNQVSNVNYYHTYTLDYAGKVKSVTTKKYDGAVVSIVDRKYTVPLYKF